MFNVINKVFKLLYSYTLSLIAFTVLSFMIAGYVKAIVLGFSTAWNLMSTYLGV